VETASAAVMTSVFVVLEGFDETGLKKHG